VERAVIESNDREAPVLGLSPTTISIYLSMSVYTYIHVYHLCIYILTHLVESAVIESNTTENPQSSASFLLLYLYIYPSRSPSQSRSLSIYTYIEYVGVDSLGRERGHRVEHDLEPPVLSLSPITVYIYVSMSVYIHVHIV